MTKHQRSTNELMESCLLNSKACSLHIQVREKRRELRKKEAQAFSRSDVYVLLSRETQYPMGNARLVEGGTQSLGVIQELTM